MIDQQSKEDMEEHQNQVGHNDELTIHQIEQIKEFRKVLVTGNLGIFQLSDILAGINGTDKQVWEIIERLMKERNIPKNIPEDIGQYPVTPDQAHNDDEQWMKDIAKEDNEWCEKAGPAYSAEKMGEDAKRFKERDEKLLEEWSKKPLEYIGADDLKLVPEDPEELKKFLEAWRRKPREIPSSNQIHYMPANDPPVYQSLEEILDDLYGNRATILEMIYKLQASITAGKYIQSGEI